MKKFWSTGPIFLDDTQDPEEDEQQLRRVKEWINSHHLDIIELTDILANFPDISEVIVVPIRGFYQ